MNLLDGGADTLHLFSVRVRGRTDALHARQRLETAMRDVRPSALGLPPGALLLVRRIAPAVRLRVDSADRAEAFGRAVLSELSRCAARARRPWLHADAVHADVVLFSDQAELVACLVRDWLRGMVWERWWWRTVLRDMTPPQWLRDRALVRGEVLAPALSLLAQQSEAREWTARLEDAEARAGIAAIARTYALSLSAGQEEPPTERPRVRGHRQNVEDGPSHSPTDMRAAARARLLAVVPEARAPDLGRAQRRLLALALALTRAPTWARTPRMALALEALDDPQIIEAATSPHPTVLPVTRRAPSVAVVRGAQAPEEVDSEPVWPRRVEARAIDAPPDIEAGRPALDPIAPPDTIPNSVKAGERSATQPDPHTAKAAREPQHIALLPTLAHTRSRVGDTPTAVDLRLEMQRTQSRDAARYAPDAVPRIATRFGGLFYLLNAALALGLYGDFTTPLSAGIALSPWDWLAMVGRAWFGHELADDPVWSVLADLAGREEGEEPERDFEPPSEGWFEEHLVVLEARIALAVNVPENEELRALVCRHEAGIEITAGTVHVFLSLRDLPLSIRIAGLDRDPGWIPAAGRDVRFFFV
jgi:hypothetical protein